MLEINQFRDVTQIKMSQSFNGKPLYWVAAYLIDGLLIDTGCAHTAEELKQFLSKQKVNQVVNTHYHEDHIGGNWVIDELFKLDIMAHPDSIPLMRQKPDLFPYQEMVWGYPQASDAVPVKQFINTPDYTFEILTLAGHCPGHIVLLEKKQHWCFVGDIFVSPKPKVIRPEESVVDLLASWRILAREFEGEFTLFTSIGNIITPASPVLAAGISYLENTIDKILEMQAAGWEEGSICQEIFGGEGNFTTITNGQFSPLHLIRSVVQAQPPHL